MFTRVVELICKSGKAKELADTIDEKAMPILKKQRGFVDEMVLVSDVEPNRILGISIWNNKADAEQYHREQFPKIHDLVRHLLDSDPAVRTFDVHTSTTHRIAAGKAAWWWAPEIEKARLSALFCQIRNLPGFGGPAYATSRAVMTNQ
jgi:quinol monooxygenase YgiN